MRGARRDKHASVVRGRVRISIWNDAILTQHLLARLDLYAAAPPGWCYGSNRGSCNQAPATMHTEVQNRRLVVRAGGHHCALALPDVAETMRPLAIEPVAGAPEGVRGLAVIRGVPVPVVDLAAVLGSPRGPRWTRFVSVRAGTRTVALAVEAVVGIREFDASTLNQMPPLMQGANPEIIASVSALDAELFLVLKTARLWREEIGAPGKGG